MCRTVFIAFMEVFECLDTYNLDSFNQFWSSHRIPRIGHPLELEAAWAWTIWGFYCTYTNQLLDTSKIYYSLKL